MQRDSPMFINGASGPEIGLPSRISGSAHFVCFVVPGHVPVPTTRCTVPITRSDNFLCNCNGFRTRKQRFLSKAVVAGGRGHRRLCTATLSPRLCSLAATQVVQVLAETDILFPLHVHWLCNSFFVMHVVRGASGREPTNAYRPLRGQRRSEGHTLSHVAMCIGYAIRFSLCTLRVALRSFCVGRAAGLRGDRARVGGPCGS